MNYMTCYKWVVNCVILYVSFCLSKYIVFVLWLVGIIIQELIAALVD